MPRDLLPVWDGYLADPFVLRVGKIYYAYGTGADDAGASAGAHFPILRSVNLTNWNTAGYGFDAGARDAYWAPEVAERNGLFYLYYSSGGSEGENHQLRIATAKDPAGPFVRREDAVVSGEPFSIDAHPFQDPIDDRWYLFFAKDFFDGRAGTGIAAAPLSNEMDSLAGPIKTILRASADWQIFARDRFWYGRRWDAWHTVEGPFVVFRQDRYWLFYSGGLWKGEDYGISYAVADNVLGPYEEGDVSSGPRLLKTSNSLRGPGHCSLFIGPDGHDRIAFHAWDRRFERRQIHIAPLTWSASGPIVPT